VVVLALSAFSAMAGAGPRDGRPPAPPIIAALDANADGTIDASEIANAPAALKTLDKNGDGALTFDELFPGPPPGGPGKPPSGGDKPPAPPFMAALDANGDGTIDAGEIANAAAALKTLDKNGDGALTFDELCPGPPPGGPGRHPIPPIEAALDANKDGVIDASEIANAPAALLTLDKNGDGVLTMDELRPAPPEGQGNRRGGQSRPSRR
jgi:hypothetical protein